MNVLWTFSSVSSVHLVALFGGSSTPDITWHNLQEYCFSLSTSRFSNSLVFVAIKLQDCALHSICSRLVTRLVNLSNLLSWILIISRRPSTFGLEEEVVLAYGAVVTGVSDSVVAGVDEVDLFLVFILLLLLFPTILASVLLLISCRLLLEFSQVLSQATILFKPPWETYKTTIKLVCSYSLAPISQFGGLTCTELQIKDALEIFGGLA